MFAIGLLAITLGSGGYTTVGGTNGALALSYGGDSIWVYASSPQGPFAFHASKALLATWADSASVTSFPNHTTARFSYIDADVHDTVHLELTRLSPDVVTGYQCTAIVGRWSGSVVLSPDSAQRFFTLLHGKPPVVPEAQPSPQETIFDFQVEQQARPAPNSAPPVYPPPLVAAGISGQVLAQFAVDTMGLVDLSTFKVLKSTNPWLTSAVFQAMPYLRFTPAQRKGRKVRELIQQPYAFGLRR